MDLRKVVAVTGPGWTGGPTPERRSYFFGREIERWAEFRAAPVMQGTPTHHDKDMTLCNGMLIAGLLQEVDIDQLAHCMLEAHWRDDADLADKKTLIQLGNSAGIDPEPLLDAALSPQVQAVYASNTEEAISRSVFGSPTYFVDGDMFYGQDHLEMVERALERPFAGPWPRS
jgi:2-hydroxychromene-2-carboxylate isomerase